MAAGAVSVAPGTRVPVLSVLTGGGVSTGTTAPGVVAAGTVWVWAAAGIVRAVRVAAATVRIDSIASGSCTGLPSSPRTPRLAGREPGAGLVLCEAKSGV